MLQNVSYVLIRHIHDAERLIRNPTEASLLFHEYEFVRHEWNVYSARGYSSTMPLFYFNFEEVAYEVKEVDHGDVVKFMNYVIERM